MGSADAIFRRRETKAGNTTAVAGYQRICTLSILMKRKIQIKELLYTTTELFRRCRIYFRRQSRL